MRVHPILIKRERQAAARRIPRDRAGLPRVQCPAARAIAGVDAFSGGVVCVVMEHDRAKEEGWHLDGTAFNPAQLAAARDGSDGVFLSARGDYSTIERLCCGSGVPVMHDADIPGGRDTHTYCPVWQAERERIWDLRDMLEEDEEPELFESYESPEARAAAQGAADEDDDPWAQARRDLKLLEG